jgi:hypothetical protein
VDERQRPGLGIDFVEEVDTTIAAIAANPRVFAQLGSRGREMRRAVVARFPFAVVYLVMPAEIVILAVANTRRRPNYRRRRQPR